VADDGAEVVGIFDAVEQNDQADLAFGFVGVVEEAFERGRLSARRRRLATTP